MSKPDSQEELKKKAVELAKLVRHCGLTCRPLGTDLTFAVKEWQKDRKCQFWSRTALRCLCAAIEATLFNFRVMAEKMGALAKVQFDPKEVEILSGFQIKNGVQRPKMAFLFGFRERIVSPFRKSSRMSYGCELRRGGICRPLRNF
jgi:hypothetical protein